MSLARPMLIALLGLGLTGCAQQAASPPPSAPSTAAGVFGPTETAFAELVIATDDQAVKLLDAGAARVVRPALRELAAELGSARRAERETLHELLKQAGVAYVDNHQGHDMPGMPTEPELSALARAADFDAEFIRLLRAHLTESSTVATSAAESITHPATKEVAGRMTGQREVDLARLAQLTGG
ncbi:DUF305 domain-containing protein [Crossiella cryophila]|uniref:Uncharacterized protein (DUF305 family) n=1 Tax=Crossiella cryophila TaxID=43355 RepID=A0A7W7CBY4_9PSEU|nr:DUF305 domain-containing protein [Crossiella cryophila]MBB4678300.1 uncharacterized protein (DUF305 family) [Crossiella cryophila]